MRKNALPPANVLRHLLEYQPESGELIWRSRTPDMFPSSKGYPSRLCAMWNGKFAGKPVCNRRSWYLSLMIDGRSYYAQRVIWKLVHGVEPDEVDHINGDPLDNRLENLRNVSPTTNRRNKRTLVNNTSGCAGVRPYHGRWQARYSQRYLGTFDSFDGAVAARQAEEERVGHIQRS